MNADEQFVYLDTETTGLDPVKERIVQIAIVDHAGKVLIDSLVDPVIAIPANATAIHGITDAMVFGKPKIEQLLPLIFDAVRNKVVVIYNKHFDLGFLPHIKEVAAATECAMFIAKKRMHVGKFPRLADAAEFCGHDWSGTSMHSAVGDALAARTVFLACKPADYQPRFTTASTAPQGDLASDVRDMVLSYPHLPYGADNELLTKIAAHVCERAAAYVQAQSSAASN